MEKLLPPLVPGVRGRSPNSPFAAPCAPDSRPRAVKMGTRVVCRWPPPNEMSIPLLIRRCGQRPKVSHATFEFLFPLVSTPSCEGPPKHLTPPATLRAETGKEQITGPARPFPGLDSFELLSAFVAIPRGWLRPSSDRLSAGPKVSRADNFVGARESPRRKTVRSQPLLRSF